MIMPSKTHYYKKRLTTKPSQATFFGTILNMILRYKHGMITFKS